MIHPPAKKVTITLVVLWPQTKTPLSLINTTFLVLTLPPCLVYLYQISYLLVKANSLNRSRRRKNHRLADRPKAHPTVHILPRNDGQGLHLTAMFHPATPEFEGSFVELHDLLSQFYLLIADPLRRTCRDVALARLVAASYLTLSFLRKQESSPSHFL